MKIHQNRNINTSSTSRRKQTSSSKFGSLFASEMETSTSEQETAPTQHSEEAATPAQQRAVFKQATELLDQALEQWEVDGALTKDTMTSIQQARQQLGLLSSQDPALAQAETLLAVESKRLQMLNH
ncbi:MAG: hypothetical protein Q9M21_08065 [Mariprofundaceae bacterium]|nr:hypothetical protein [Mariprofundaceae bacterium]